MFVCLSVNTPAHNLKPGCAAQHIYSESDWPSVIPQGDRTIQELASYFRR